MAGRSFPSGRHILPGRNFPPARQELPASQEFHDMPVLLRKLDHHTVHPHQMPQHSLTQIRLT